MKKKGFFKSQKLFISLLAMGLIFAAFFAMRRFPGLENSYSELIFGLLAAASIYSGSNSVITAFALRNKASKRKPNVKQK